MVGKRFTLAAFALATAAASAVPAGAQFRPGSPPTLPRPPQAADPADRVHAYFSSAYAARSSPRMAVFWNRAFDDEVSSQFRDRSRTEALTTNRGITSEEESEGPSGKARIEESDAEEKYVSETVSGTERVTNARASLVDEPIDWEVEQAFGEALRSAGVRVVDRAVMIRTAGMAAGAGERANVQAIETDGLVGKADLLVEVLQTPDRRSPDGISFRVTVRDVRTAELLASLTSSGRPDPGPMPLVAGPRGFERARPREPGPAQIGRQLALETMAAISRAWR